MRNSSLKIKIKQEGMYYLALAVSEAVIALCFFGNVAIIVKITNTINEYDALILLMFTNVIFAWFIYMSYHAKDTYIIRVVIYLFFFFSLYYLTNIFHAVNNFSFYESGYIKNERYIISTQQTNKIMVNKNASPEGRINVISVFSMSGKSIYCNDDISDDLRKKNSISFLRLRVDNEVSRYCFIGNSLYN